jgi:hypothetical protein
MDERKLLKRLAPKPALATSLRVTYAVLPKRWASNGGAWAAAIMSSRIPIYRS